MSTFYDTLETRTPAEREAALMAALPVQIAHARNNAPAFAALLAGIDPATITSRAALATLPVTRKHALHERQQAARIANGLAQRTYVLPWLPTPPVGVAALGALVAPDVVLG